MNAVSAGARIHVRHRAEHHDGAARARRRRRAIIATVGATFLGLYVLGISWFANELQADMQRNLQLAPAIQDVQHR